jgi:glyoxylase-like metal-dependent hydrolase (beta-lactamase superfamily II)
MNTKHFFDQETATFTYIVSDEDTLKCAIIDPVLNYNMSAGNISSHSADEVVAYISDNNLTVAWILETHAHADHLTASHYLKEKLGGQIAMGERIDEVIKFWRPVFNTDNYPELDSFKFDKLLKNNEVINIGSLEVRVMNTPGHTPACVSYLIEDNVFVGDTIFMPDVGTARTDFPGGSAQDLFDSIQKIFALPLETNLYTAHDYPPEDRAVCGKSTVGQQRKNNMMIGGDTSKEQFVDARKAKDKLSDTPKLLLPSIQVNIQAGNLPVAEENNIRYIKIPVNQL